MSPAATGVAACRAESRAGANRATATATRRNAYGVIGCGSSHAALRRTFGASAPGDLNRSTSLAKLTGVPVAGGDPAIRRKGWQAGGGSGTVPAAKPAI